MPRAAAGTGYPPLRQSHCESGGACGVEALSRGSKALISLSVYPRRIEYWAKTFSRLGSASRADWLAVSGARARGGAYTLPLWNVDEHRKVHDRTQQLGDAVGPDWEHGWREERRSTGKMDNLVVPAPVELCNDGREAVRAADHPSARDECKSCTHRSSELADWRCALRIALYVSGFGRSSRRYSAHGLPASHSLGAWIGSTMSDKSSR